MNPEEIPLNSNLKRVSLVRMVWEFLLARGDIYAFFLRIYRRFGDNIRVPFGIRTYLLNDPRDLRHILLVNIDNYIKGGALVVASKFLGRGLLTSENTEHHRHRRAMQPMFHRQRIQTFGEIMVSCANRRASLWKEGEVQNISLEMMHLTSSVISRALFSIDLEEEARELSDAITAAQRYLVERVKAPIVLPATERARVKRYEDAVDRMDASLLTIIRERAAPGAPIQDDMLNMLMEIRFEDGAAMTEKEIRDEIITLFLAGHETSANTLTWTFYLLSQNPEAEALLHQELDTVLAGRDPTLADIPNLPYTDMVMWESLRLFPPLWVLGREALEDDILPSRTKVEKGSQVLIVNWAAHRNPRQFAEPDAFRPERFKEKIGIAQGYLPFGTGMRSCIGEPFARMEIVLSLATLCQRYKFRLAPGQNIKPDLLLLLRPKNGLMMIPERRVTKGA